MPALIKRLRAGAVSRGPPPPALPDCEAGTLLRTVGLAIDGRRVTTGVATAGLGVRLGAGVAEGGGSVAAATAGAVVAAAPREAACSSAPAPPPETMAGGTAVAALGAVAIGGGVAGGGGEPVGGGRAPGVEVGGAAGVGVGVTDGVEVALGAGVGVREAVAVASAVWVCVGCGVGEGVGSAEASRARQRKSSAASKDARRGNPSKAARNLRGPGVNATRARGRDPSNRPTGEWSPSRPVAKIGDSPMNDYRGRYEHPLGGPR